MTTIKLLRLLLNDISVLIILIKNLLSYFRMHRCACPAKIIKRNIEPVINGLVNMMKFVTNLLRSRFLKTCFDFRCSPILICSTYKQYVVTHQPAKSSVNVSR